MAVFGQKTGDIMQGGAPLRHQTKCDLMDMRHIRPDLQPRAASGLARALPALCCHHIKLLPNRPAQTSAENRQNQRKAGNQRVIGRRVAAIKIYCKRNTRRINHVVAVCFSLMEMPLMVKSVQGDNSASARGRALPDCLSRCISAKVSPPPALSPATNNLVASIPSASSQS